MRRFEKVKEYGIIPKRQTKHSAGYDFYIPEDIIINPDEKIFLPLGVSAQMEEDDVLLINIRSSIGIKKGIILSNIQGVIDSDYYPNEIYLGIWNTSNQVQKFPMGERLCQGIFVKYQTAEEDDVHEERNGGIGSTDKNKITVICGESCAGKDWLISQITNEGGYKRIVTATTRPKRDCEEYGREYDFISITDLEKNVREDKIICVRKFTAFIEGEEKIYFYGVWNRKDEYLSSKDKLVIILDPKGISDFIKYIGRDNIKIIYLKTPENIRHERYKSRGNYSLKEWNRRLEADDNDFKNFENILSKDDYILYDSNDYKYLL